VLPAGVAMVDASTGQLTGALASADDRYSYGDLAGSSGEMLCVREHEHGDELVAVDDAVPRVLMATDGFLAAPRRRAGRLAWVQWRRDVMPWDSCEVWVADYLPGGGLGAPLRVAGGQDESAFQPVWGADGTLYFVSDRTGWWNLYRWQDGRIEAVAPMQAECAAAPWESGYANYVLLPGGRIGMTVQQGPRHRLIVVEPGGALTPLEVPYTFIKPFLAAVGDRIALIGASPTRSQEVALVATDGSNHVEVVRPGSEVVDESALSVPEVLRVGSGGDEVTVLFYPPTERTGPAPLIVRPHTGPTYGVDYRLDWEVQFFTARGFAVADVDYRGSTGYGRGFRKVLDGRWGSLDVEDCRNAALHLLATGRALPSAVFISGASAGGYTALRAVCEDGPFSLAVARSAIVDPNRWRTTAPRFQRPHAAVLAHDDAKVRPEQVRRPVLLVHGADDDVAPVDDVVELAHGLKDRRLLTLDGVGHYLASAALAAALDAELDAYIAVLKDAGG
jgi:dipeptidyl aminopeptidase/acylaminoacyl peptidase